MSQRYVSASDETLRLLLDNTRGGGGQALPIRASLLRALVLELMDRRAKDIPQAETSRLPPDFLDRYSFPPARSPRPPRISPDVLARLHNETEDWINQIEQDLQRGKFTKRSTDHGKDIPHEDE